eukprot:snap_masked-scaffold_21-processed-gene-5.48-mRNA-1 protein AED:1.00 eAED:1.00 QI:0/-1/0/0/-1/1/1/0/174
MKLDDKFEEYRRIEKKANKLQDILSTKVRPLINNRNVDINVDDVVDYAKKLSFTTRAPVKWGDLSLDQLPPPFKAPYPQISQIKQGILFSDLYDLIKNLKLHKQQLEEEKKREFSDDQERKDEFEAALNRADEDFNVQRSLNMTKLTEIKKEENVYDLGFSSDSDDEDDISDEE